MKELYCTAGKIISRNTLVSNDDVNDYKYIQNNGVIIIENDLPLT